MGFPGFALMLVLNVSYLLENWMYFNVMLDSQVEECLGFCYLKYLGDEVTMRWTLGDVRVLFCRGCVICPSTVVVGF